MLTLMNQLEQRILAALNAVDAPKFMTDREEWESPRTWHRCEPAWDSIEDCVFRRHGGMKLLFRANGTIEASDGMPKTQDELLAIVDYMRRCEMAIVGLDDGEVMVQRRDIDDALQAVNPAFRKTDAFRRLDAALGI